MNLANQIVLLTGASRGIGVAIARDLGKAGAHVVLTARDLAGLERVAAEVRVAGGKATVVAADVSTAEGRATIVTALDAVGPVLAFVSNAGLEVPTAVHEQTHAQIEKQIAVNLTGPILLTRALLPGMIARGKGAIALVSSMSGKSPTPFNAIYSATKHGLNGFASSLRIELDGTGVHAGVVCPSFVAEAGMWHDTGLAAPGMMREVPLAKVVAAVRAVLGGKGEVLVTPSPVRPLLALAQLIPGLDGPVLRALGVMTTLKSRARTTIEKGASE
ncbi:MAG: SDR family NAD(P)-dependent oxidoreductase [Pseudomonadota bacterium]|nr:SDR family NAD(P)-dependent oxidoreductase [Pseudomonadota bacterium]